MADAMVMIAWYPRGDSPAGRDCWLAVASVRREGDPAELWVGSTDILFSEDPSPAWMSAIAWTPEGDGPAGLDFWLEVAAFVAEEDLAELWVQFSAERFPGEPTSAEPGFAVNWLPWELGPAEHMYAVELVPGRTGPSRTVVCGRPVPEGSSPRNTGVHGRLYPWRNGPSRMIRGSAASWELGPSRILARWTMTVITVSPLRRWRSTLWRASPIQRAASRDVSWENCRHPCPTELVITCVVGLIADVTHTEPSDSPESSQSSSGSGCMEMKSSNETDWDLAATFSCFLVSPLAYFFATLASYKSHVTSSHSAQNIQLLNRWHFWHPAWTPQEEHILCESNEALKWLHPSNVFKLWFTMPAVNKSKLSLMATVPCYAINLLCDNVVVTAHARKPLHIRNNVSNPQGKKMFNKNTLSFCLISGWWKPILSRQG